MRRIFTISLLFCILFPLMPASGMPQDVYERRRADMVEKDIKARGIRDGKVLQAMAKVPRHLFVEDANLSRAYGDHPLPIGEGQTISQPYVVALMSEALSLKGKEKVLEIGTGSGYQAAILAEMGCDVYTVEIKKGLYEKVQKKLVQLGYGGIRVKNADGYFGWEAFAPFDAIMVTAAANHIPPPLLRQLKEGGRLIIPLGSTLFFQNLALAVKTKGKYAIRELGSVAFVPMTGEVQKK